MPYDVEKLWRAITRAKLAARKVENTPDTGTCNYDEAFIYAPRMSEATARRLGGHIRKSRLRGRLLMLGGVDGQGARRTAMAEAMYQSLKRDGVDAGIWYQVD